MSSHTGRAVHWLFWTLPARAVKRASARGMALVTMETQRWLTLAVFGVWVWGFWWVAKHLIPPLRIYAAALVLFWFWRVYVNARRSMHNRTWRARQYQIEMAQFQIIRQLPAMIQQSLLAAYQAGADMRDYGPAHAQTRQMERDQADQVRGWVDGANGEGVPTGEWQPVTPMPRWLKRRLGRKGRDE